MNNISLVGRVMFDPEIKFLESGQQVASLKLSVNRGTGKKDANGYPVSDVFQAKVWGKRAETLAEYVKKGSILAVTGRLETTKVPDGKGVYIEVADASWSFVPKDNSQQEQESGF